MGRKAVVDKKKNLQVYIETSKIEAVGGDLIAKEIAYKAIENEGIKALKKKK